MKIKRAYILIVMLFILPMIETAMAEKGYYVKRVAVSGNNKTDDKVILRQMDFTIPGTVNEKQIAKLQERLNNITIFKRAEVSVSDSVLYIYITEGIQYYIYPELKIIDRSWHKLNFGLNFTHFNIGRQNIYLNLYGATGYNPGFYIYLYDDWFTSRQLIAGIKLFHGTVKHKLYDFPEIHSSYSFIFGKRIKHDLTLTFTRGIHTVTFTNKELLRFPNSDSKVLYWQNSLSLICDKRNYAPFPTSGLYIAETLSNESEYFSDLKLMHYFSDIRLYIPFHGITLGIRNYLHTAVDDLPIYDGVFLGLEQKIRGYFYEIYTGRALMMNHLEMRFPLLKPRYYNLNTLAEYSPEFLQTHLTNLRFGIYGAFFAESASIEHNVSDFTLRSAHSGQGVSIYFILPSHNTFRIDAAVNDKGNRELIIESRVSF